MEAVEFRLGKDVSGRYCSILALSSSIVIGPVSDDLWALVQVLRTSLPKDFLGPENGAQLGLKRGPPTPTHALLEQARRMQPSRPVEAFPLVWYSKAWF